MRRRYLGYSPRSGALCASSHSHPPENEPLAPTPVRSLSSPALLTLSIRRAQAERAEQLEREAAALTQQAGRLPELEAQMGELRRRAADARRLQGELEQLAPQVEEVPVLEEQVRRGGVGCLVGALERGGPACWGHGAGWRQVEEVPVQEEQVRGGGVGAMPAHRLGARTASTLAALSGTPPSLTLGAVCRSCGVELPLAVPHVSPASSSLPCCGGPQVVERPFLQLFVGCVPSLLAALLVARRWLSFSSWLSLMVSHTSPLSFPPQFFPRARRWWSCLPCDVASHLTPLLSPSLPSCGGPQVVELPSV